jgi:4-amino-4-deoxy-L-arabinose transferase-like glycosyltransferase
MARRSIHKEIKDGSTHWRPLGIILAFALILRISWALYVPVVTMSDSHAYDVFARNLLQFGVFGWTENEPFAFWPPGTSLLYAFVYALFGVHFEVIVILNLILSLLLIVVSYRLATRWFGATIGLTTAAVLAGWPTLVAFTTVLASELPYLLLTMAALDAWTSERLNFLLRALLSGVLLGAAALVRPQALALPFVYWVGVWLWRGIDKAEFKSQVVFLLIVLSGAALIITPWTVRNLILFDDLVLISTNGGITFWMGNSPGTNGAYMPIPERLAGLNDLEVSRVLNAEAWQYIRSEPIEFLLRTAKKFVQLFNNESIGIHWNAQGISKAFGDGALLPMKRFTQLTWALIVLLAVFGVWRAAKQVGWTRLFVSPAILSILFYAAVHSVVVSQDRYHLAFASFWAMFAAWGLLALHEKVKKWTGGAND